MRHRIHGASLVEVLIVIGILAVLIGLILGGIQRARETSVRAQSMNNLRQLAIGVHQYATANDGRLPVDGQKSVFHQVAIYCELDWTNPVDHKLFQSPADPTLAGNNPKTNPGLTSYSCNRQIFNREIHPTLSGTLSDGASSTIMLGEQYGWCDATYRKWHARWGDFAVYQHMPAEFAAQVVTVTTGNPPVTLPDWPDPVTFQVQPCTETRSSPTAPEPDCGTLPACDWHFNQTPHPSGMLAALADGSVRILHPKIAPETFWGAVTPAGGETLADW